LTGCSRVIRNGFGNTGIIAAMIYAFWAGKSPLFIGVRGFIAEGPPRIAPVRRT
jgi:hypothetical protein